jgi:hypothetical protein
MVQAFALRFRDLLAIGLILASLGSYGVLFFWRPDVPVRIAIWSLNVLVVFAVLSRFWPVGVRWEMSDVRTPGPGGARVSRALSDRISKIACCALLTVDFGLNVAGFNWAERSVDPLFLIAGWVVAKVMLVQVVTDWRARIGEER